MTYTNDYKYITVIWPYTQSQAILNASKWHITAKSTSFQLYSELLAYSVNRWSCFCYRMNCTSSEGSRIV